MTTKSWVNSQETVSNMYKLYQVTADSVFQVSLDESEEARMPEALRDWLGRLRLLYGVPFLYLVPNAKMLPQESARFFYVDRNWTDRMVDGALSVGKTTTREYAHHHAVNKLVVDMLDVQERLVRPHLRKLEGGKGTFLAGTRRDMTGMLMRSAVVAGWPGLEISGYRDSDMQTKLQLLRMDRLSPDVMFCLFDGIPRAVRVEEPREGLQFGVESVPVSPGSMVIGRFELKLRYMHDRPGQDAGTEVKNTNGTTRRITVPVRSGNRRVIHVKDLVSRIENQFTADELKDDDLRSAEFGVQMLQFPYVQIFRGQGKNNQPNTPPFIIDSIYENATFKVMDVIPDLSDSEKNIIKKQVESNTTDLMLDTSLLDLD